MKKLFGLNRMVLWMVMPLVAVGISGAGYLASQQIVDKIIVVDAGHGGIDPGANRPGVLEKDINLDIALQVKDILQQKGAKVIMTRDTDTDLSGLNDNEKVKGRYHRDLNARLEMVDESDADLFISIHANASSKSQRKGAECYYHGKSEASKKLAQSIEENLQAVTKISQEAAPAPYFVLKRNKVPAVLVEVGYITNAEERSLLQSPEYQQCLAEAIANGIYNYYKQNTIATMAGFMHLSFE